MTRKRSINTGELRQLALRLNYPVSGSDAARQAGLSGASDDVIMFLESIPGEVSDETELIDIAESKVGLPPEEEVSSLPLQFDQAVPTELNDG